MGVGDWFKRRFSSAPAGEAVEDDAARSEEYGGETTSEAAPEFVAGGPTGQGFVGLEDAEAADDAVRATDPPNDPAR